VLAAPSQAPNKKCLVLFLRSIACPSHVPPPRPLFGRTAFTGRIGDRGGERGGGGGRGGGGTSCSWNLSIRRPPQARQATFTSSRLGKRAILLHKAAAVSLPFSSTAVLRVSSVVGRVRGGGFGAVGSLFRWPSTLILELGPIFVYFSVAGGGAGSFGVVLTAICLSDTGTKPMCELDFCCLEYSVF